MAEKRLVNQKLLRCGYTTGTCAAAASKAAAAMLFKQETMDSVSITTPNQTDLVIDVLSPQFNDTVASCSIEKDSGDDPVSATIVVDGAVYTYSFTELIPYNITVKITYNNGVVIILIKIY